MYQNTFYNSAATFARSPRSHKVGDHFGWHTTAGPDVEERHGHVFINNLLAADDTFEGALLQFYQNPELRDRLTEPQVTALDGNVYVRKANDSAQPLIHWSPAQSEEGFLQFSAIEDFASMYPQFESHAQALLHYWGPLFRGVELGNFELLQDFPASNAGIPLPDHIVEALEWDTKAETFPGAYKPQ